MESIIVTDVIDDKRLRVQINEQELLCKNNCGFYGTPQWQNLCSQCWRVYQLEKKYTKNRVLLGQESLDKKRKFSETKTLKKNFLPRSSSFFSNLDFPQTSPSASNSAFGLKALGADNPRAQQQFLQYLNQTFVPNVAKDLEKVCLSFMDKLYKSWEISIDDARRDDTLSEMIQSFYRLMTEKISQLKVGFIYEDFKTMNFMMELENFICDHAYSILFCSKSEEEAIDLNLQERIRSLHWVTFGFLETSLDFSSEKVQYFLDEAVTEIVDLNSHRQVWKKLECLIGCSKCIFDALKESRSGAPASADEFLPVLIYIILKANPPLIQSNLNFISRYALQYRIMRGESGYYFTNLSCALQFIQNMNAESLHLSKEEFDAYTSGKRVPPKRSSINSSALKSIDESIKKVETIAKNNELLVKKFDDLDELIKSDCAKFSEKVAIFSNEEDDEETKKIRISLNSENSPDLLKNLNFFFDNNDISTALNKKANVKTETETHEKLKKNNLETLNSTKNLNQKKFLEVTVKDEFKKKSEEEVVVKNLTDINLEKISYSKKNHT